MHNPDANSCPQRAVHNKNIVTNGKMEACTKGYSWFWNVSLYRLSGHDTETGLLIVLRHKLSGT